MALYQFRLPDVGEGIAEAEITVWHIKPGDAVKEDQSLLDVMTDKATVDITSPVDGVVTAIHGEVGAMMPVRSVIVELEIAGDEADAGPAPVTVLAAPAVEPTSHSVKPAQAPVPSSLQTTMACRAVVDAVPVAAPSTRRRALQAGIDLRDVPATHKTGRVTSHDLDAYLERLNEVQGAAKGGIYAARTGVAETRIIGLRRKIAGKMQEAKRRIPHISYVEEVDVTELEALRQDINAHKTDDQPKLTLLPFLIHALVRALPDFPQINAHYDDDAGVLQSHEGVHVGIATQTSAGLMVPVVRHAESHDLRGLAGELARLSSAARNGTVTRDELTGSTITITSLGPLGGIATTPVINHPEVAIIGPNKIVDRPLIHGNFVSVRKMMNLSSSFDHRIVDGYDAALFVQRLKRLIEHPALIFMA